ncbi:Os08g0465400 [Oryza sativa Japonica Group]|uniref:Os08g0465400 protein n=3 Tax=Oryza TaxID=4527 RepID=Q0J555_ORYSJ|nr:hypothetical protein EE612_044769 [Oryza sativa]BAF23910.1 Os08g0465400 [Oryza sativa Japonica Group]BAT05796.1 Os08g0465400 [Oryza sativa Japonica Group]|eukprot:NP_001061996.1 Os08g0465400 [Oryza sativa Japonica Group]
MAATFTMPRMLSISASMVASLNGMEKKSPTAMHPHHLFDNAQRTAPAPSSAPPAEPYSAPRRPRASSSPGGGSGVGGRAQEAMRRRRHLVAGHRTPASPTGRLPCPLPN